MRRVSRLELWRAFGRCSLGTRLHVVVRSVLCPMGRIAGAAPLRGRCLDIGCGHGLFAYYLTAASADRSVLAIDVSQEKISEAMRSGLAGPRLEFRHQDYANVTEGDFDLISLLDVLYLVPVGVQRAIIRWSHDHLVPRGILLIKEITDRPRWKYWLNYVEETLAVNVFGITFGQQLHFRSAGAFALDLAAAGFEVEVERIDRGYMHPHVMLVCRKRSQ